MRKIRHTYLSKVSLVKGSSGTARCFAVNPDTGRKVQVRILLDGGANTALITRKAAKKLKLTGPVEEIHLSIAGNMMYTSKERLVSFHLQSLDGSYETPFEIPAYTIEDIGQPFDPLPINPEEFPHLHDINFTEDYPIYEDRPFEILVAEPYYSALMCPAQSQGEFDEPTAKLTKLGWILRGAIPEDTSHIHAIKVDEELDPFDPKLWRKSMESFDFRKFWDSETIGISSREKDSKVYTELELRALKMMEENSFQDPKTKVWYTQFLWRDPDPENRRLKDNTKPAVAIMHKVEDKYGKDKEIKPLVAQAYQDLEDETWVENVPENEINPEHPTYVLTSRVVVKPERKTTKARPIINASKPCPITKKTLNLLMLPGPNLLPHIMTCQMVARRFRYIFTIDIRKMFFSVRLALKSDKDMVRYFWGNFTGHPKLKRFCVLPFGVISSPFQAIWCIQKTARKWKKHYPEAANVILNYLYMDDICTGADTPKDAIKLLHELLFLISEAGFKGHKISSNCKAVLESLQEALRDNCTETKVLGLKLDHSKNVFKFDLDDKFQDFNAESEFVSRRQCVSIGSQVFDTQGFVAPFIMQFKQIIPKLWHSGAKWDANLIGRMIKIDGVEQLDQVAQEAVKIFRNWVLQIPLLKQLEFPRWVGGPIEFLIVFTDASKVGMGACAYTVARNSRGHLVSTLAYCKTQIMPKALRAKAQVEDTMTIARAELAGMQIGINLGQYVATAYGIPFDRIYYRTDSLLNLQRLQRGPGKSLKWEYNRLAYITANLAGGHFGFVPGKLNPADLPSRGCSLEELIKVKDFWIHGPEFIVKPKEEWPKQPVIADPDKEYKEAEKNAFQGVDPDTRRFLHAHNVQVLHVHAIQRAQRIRKETIEEAQKLAKPIGEILRRHGDWHFNLRVVGNYLRLKDIVLKHKQSLKTIFDVKNGPGEVIAMTEKPAYTAPLSRLETERAENTLVKYAQEKDFMREILIMKQGPISDENPLPRDSTLRHFNCFYDDKIGLIRIRTRLREGLSLPEDIRNPILLPKGDVAERILLQLHWDGQHMTQRQTWATVREKYWLLGGKTYVKKCLKICLVPKCRTLRFQRPQMSPLPEFRTTGQHCWNYVGVDYAGPINVAHECIDTYSTLKNTAKHRFNKMSKATMKETLKTLVAQCPHHDQDTKLWLVFFTCLHTRAIHIEIVRECSTRGFLDAVCTFMGHKGVPIKFYSDNAKYFKAADKELKTLLNAIDFDQVKAQQYQGAPVSWDYSTPEAPWTNGITERVIGLFKKHFRVACNANKRLTAATVKTLTSEIINILNNRPLDAYIDDQNEVLPITPNMLIYGRNLGMLRTPSPATMKDLSISFKDKWILRKQILCSFWEHWTKQYLGQLAISNKWQKKEDIRLHKEDIVVVKDETMGQKAWQLAKIIEIENDSNGNQIKALVELNTHNRVLKHLRNLALLESHMDKKVAPSTVARAQKEAQEAKDATVQMGSVVSECETTRKDVGTLDGSDVAPSGPGLPLVTVAPIHVRSLPIVACGSETNDSQLDHTQNVPAGAAASASATATPPGSPPAPPGPPRRRSARLNKKQRARAQMYKH